MIEREALAGWFTCDVNRGLEHPPGGTIYEDAHWIADHAVSRLIRGYLILKPKRHVHELADLLAEEAATLGPAMQKLLAAMREALSTERIYVCSFAETVHHLHFHLLPRTHGMPGLGPDLLPSIFDEEKWLCGEAEAEEAAHQVRASLAQSPDPRT